MKEQTELGRAKLVWSTLGTSDSNVRGYVNIGAPEFGTHAWVGSLLPSAVSGSQLWVFGRPRPIISAENFCNPHSSPEDSQAKF